MSHDDSGWSGGAGEALHSRPVLRVGIDYLVATTHFPGVGRYARELVRALVAEPDRDLQLRLFEAGAVRRRVPKVALGLAGAAVPVRRLRLPLPRRVLAPLVDRVGADRLLGGVDVYHRMAVGAPRLARARSVYAVAELPAGDGERPLAQALAREDLVLTFSQHALDELRARFGVSAERSALVPVGADHWVRDLAGPGGPPERDDPPMVLVLGALRRERHHEEILNGFDRWVGSSGRATLVFAGGRGDAVELVQRRLNFAASRAHIRWVEHPGEAELAALVARASLLVHLSETECTAVTPLEALSVGTPVLVSDTPVFREALLDLAQYVPTPMSLRHRKALPEQLAAGVESARDAVGEADRRTRGAVFTWGESARVHGALYRRLAEA